MYFSTCSYGLETKRKKKTMDAWPMNFTLIVKERTKLKGGIKKQG
jgi:hypothetical protein